MKTVNGKIRKSSTAKREMENIRVKIVKLEEENRA